MILICYQTGRQTGKMYLIRTIPIDILFKDVLPELDLSNGLLPEIRHLGHKL